MVVVGITIYNVSNRNIFVAIEYIRAGLEQGFLYFKANEWHLNRQAIEKIALSKNVYDMILQRVENSSTKSKELLQASALMGNVFTPHEVARVVFKDTEGIDEILRQLENLSLIEKISGSK